ncbi:MAG: hypothetical protein KGN84_21115, partial [Acidobacteriota bacterium]|nr:hypothetical protein [Acidobacteriota bacterium]
MPRRRPGGLKTKVFAGLALATFVRFRSSQELTHIQEVPMLNKDDLKRLAGIQGPCLTLFEPVRDGGARENNPEARIAAAAHRAAAMLAERGYSEESREEFIRPILKVAANTNWENRIGSVVIFRSPGFTKADFWPDELESTLRLEEEFFVLPLIGRITARTDFWFLALSLKEVRLFRLEGDGFQEVGLGEGVPVSLRSAGGFDVPERDLEGRSAPGVSTGQTAAIRFGTQSFREARNLYIHDFFKRIDRAVRPIVARTDDPLVVAGVARELAAYREVNTC